MRSAPLRFWLSLAGVLALASPAQAQRDGERRSPLPKEMPLGVDACFGRTYDAAHLKRHPRQRVASLHLLRDLTPDRSTEDPPQTAEEMKANDGQYGSVMVSAFVRFRDRPRTYWNILSCSHAGEHGVRCGVDCDGGSFGLRPLPKADGLLLENAGFVVLGGCGADDDEETVNVSPGADDRTFRLDRQPLAACLAMRDAVRPAWARLGPPLRERLDRTEGVCFSRRYDAAHLAKHPKQTVRGLAVLKPAGAKPGNEASHRLTFRVEMRDGRRIEKTAQCYTERYAYACSPSEPDGGDAQVYLTRAGEGAAMLRDPKGRLSTLIGTALGDDDRLFRLNASDATACGY